MNGILWLVGGLSVVVGILGLVVWPWWRRRRDAERLANARNLFHLRREWLEADFVKLASRAIEESGVVWSDCDFEDEVAFATARTNRQLCALVAITIYLVPSEKGEDAGVRGSARRREATAVFHFDGRRWFTEGRTIFNLNPLEAIEHFQHELEMVD
jgi:hypothetical protein